MKKQTKVVEIASCLFCPYHIENYVDPDVSLEVVHLCSHKEVNNKEIEQYHVEDFPVWCPLGDA
jgi:hypothetical protein